MNRLGCERVHVDMTYGSLSNFFTPETFGAKERKLFCSRVDFHFFPNDSGWGSGALPFQEGDCVILHVFPWISQIDLMHGIELFKDCSEIGIAIDLQMPVKKLARVFLQVTTILVMGIPAGESGQPLDKNALQSLRRLRTRTWRKSVRIGIDGGVNKDTFASLVPITDFLIVGGILFDAPSMTKRWRCLNSQMIVLQGGMN